MYILADGSIDTYLTLHDEELILDHLKVSGSILGQYSLIMQKNINYSARSTLETNMLVINLETLNQARADNHELNLIIKKMIEHMSNKHAMPMLDYTVVRKEKKESDEFNARQVFIDAFEKWRKIFKYSRKKAFKFSDLVEFVNKNKVSELEQKKA